MNSLARTLTMTASSPRPQPCESGFSVTMRDSVRAGWPTTSWGHGGEGGVIVVRAWKRRPALATLAPRRTEPGRWLGWFSGVHFGPPEATAWEAVVPCPAARRSFGAGIPTPARPLGDALWDARLSDSAFGSRAWGSTVPPSPADLRRGGRARACAFVCVCVCVSSALGDSTSDAAWHRSQTPSAQKHSSPVPVRLVNIRLLRAPSCSQQSRDHGSSLRAPCLHLRAEVPVGLVFECERLRSTMPRRARTRAAARQAFLTAARRCGAHPGQRLRTAIEDRGARRVSLLQRLVCSSSRLASHVFRCLPSRMNPLNFSAVCRRRTQHPECLARLCVARSTPERAQPWFLV